MPELCHHCRNPISAGARFCGKCGRSLSTRERGGISKPQCCGPGGGRRARACLLVSLIALGGVIFFTNTNHRSLSRIHTGSTLIVRHFDLDGAERSVMISLLVPKDVDVRVYVNEPGLVIRGTPEEVHTVERFVGLMDGWDGIDFDTSDPIPVTYKLPRSKAKALRNALTLSDGRVRVSRSGSRVRISATKRDHDTIKRMVHILSE